MTGLDWVVLIGTLAFIALYGAWKTRDVKDVADYVRGGNTLRWPTIGLSIMATQASAITFLSVPGQAFSDGMRFVQFYLGLPIAMIVISAVFVPIYYRLNVYTAYEYLEHRFDARVRYLGAVLFLIQRGLSAGVTIYAPSIVLSSIFGWSVGITNILLGLAVILYTVTGGTRAVSQTQKQQMVVMLGGMGLAGALLVFLLPDEVSVPTAVKLAGALGRMDVVDFSFEFQDRYNFWSGITGGFFLALAYFGTDQSQVQRYLSGRSVAESRLGLLFNGMFKIPMQFGILFIGALLFVFYLFTRPPVAFDSSSLARVRASAHAAELEALEARHQAAFERERAAALAYVEHLEAAKTRAPEPAERSAPELREAETETEQSVTELRAAAEEMKKVRADVVALVRRVAPDAKTNDGDYVFLRFVLDYLPSGLVGLLVAVILCAAMSSIASELSALGSTSTMDLYARIRRRGPGQSLGAADLRVSKMFTILWGLVAISFGAFAAFLDNLIEAVNIMGSIFYGTLLGLFLTAFFVKRVTAKPVLIAACVAEATVIGLYLQTNLGFLWFNVVGCAIVVGLSWVLELAGVSSPKAQAA